MMSFTQPSNLPPPALHAPAKPALTRDVLWGRPLFKAPALPIPRLVDTHQPFRTPHLAKRTALAS
jgi:hypothetical protein